MIVDNTYLPATWAPVTTKSLVNSSSLRMARDLYCYLICLWFDTTNGKSQNGKSSYSLRFVSLLDYYWVYVDFYLRLVKASVIGHSTPVGLPNLHARDKVRVAIAGLRLAVRSLLRPATSDLGTGSKTHSVITAVLATYMTRLFSTRGNHFDDESVRGHPNQTLPRWCA